MPSIEVKNLSKSFASMERLRFKQLLSGRLERIKVLEDISFEVAPGELLGVMGRNGAGKSTLLRILGRVYQPDGGSVIRIDDDIASIFEMGSFLDVYTSGERYCREYLTFEGVPRKRIDALVESIRDFTELDEFFYKPIHTYSSGMQAKLLFGLSTALPAKLILIDEILVVGDEYFRGRAWKRLTDMLQDGAAGVIVSHDWVSLLKLCERTMLIENGAVSFVGETEKAVRQYLGYGFKASDEITFLNKQALASNIFEAVNGAPLSVRVPVRVIEPPEKGALRAAFVVERLVKGIGWTPALICEDVFPMAQKGDYEIELAIGRLDLAPGDWTLRRASIILRLLHPNLWKKASCAH